MQKYRVYELAKMLGKTNEEIITTLQKNNINVKTNFNSVGEKEKELLENVFKPQDSKKPAQKTVRTVRFDQQGKPTGKKRDTTRHSSYSSYKVEEPKEQKKESRKDIVRNEDKRMVSTREARNIDSSSMRRDNQHRHMERKTGEGKNVRYNNSRDNDSRRDFRDKNRTEKDNRDSFKSKEKGGFSDRKRSSAPIEMRAPEPVDVPRRARGGKKKTKKDYEKSRREREGGSLMARSLNQAHQKKRIQEKKTVVYPTEVSVPLIVTVKELADLFKREVGEVIKKLMAGGVMATINQNLDRDTVEILAEEFGVTLLEPQQEADLTAYTPEADDPHFLKPRPPVVTIMGHVDHGKTTLLDALRSTDVALHEAGGITQGIGAYQIRYQNHKITFLDTPGHEAFTAMRTRGAQVTDIAVIIVAADDGVMPQTVEAIHHAKAAKVPIMVAINKIDKPGANPDHIKEELSREGLISEEWGGDVIMVPISAKKKIGLEELLENILLVAEMEELKANPNREAYGVVVEAQLDKGRGPVMNVLVNNGTLRVGDSILAGKCWGRVRAMTNEKGRRMKNAEPSMPVEILGMNSVPQAGDHFYVMDEKQARSIAELRTTRAKEEEQAQFQKVTLDNIFEKIKEGEMKELAVIIKADVQGSVEALSQSLLGIKSEEVRISIVHAAAGAISESDIMLAEASNALIIGFNVRPDANARKLAEQDNVDIRLYRVIYDAIDDVKDAMTGMLTPKVREVVLGHGEIRQVIHTPKIIVAGVYVTEGKITNNCQIRLVRDGIVIHEGKIGSLRRFKDDVKEVTEGFECGLSLADYRDVKEGDHVESFIMEETAAELK